MGALAIVMVLVGVALNRSLREQPILHAVGPRSGPFALSVVSALARPGDVLTIVIDAPTVDATEPFTDGMYGTEFMIDRLQGNRWVLVRQAAGGIRGDVGLALVWKPGEAIMVNLVGYLGPTTQRFRLPAVAPGVYRVRKEFTIGSGATHRRVSLVAPFRIAEQTTPRPTSGGSRTRPVRR